MTAPTGAPRARLIQLSSLASVFALIVGALVLWAGPAEAEPVAVGLGTADPFAVLAGAGITNTGPTTVVGDIGTHPTPAITGVDDNAITGTNHGDNAVTQGAKDDVLTAYTSLAGQGPKTAIVADLGGQTLVPGVYNSESGIALTGTVTLDGKDDPDSVFVFQAESTLITSSLSDVKLINGAQACNVFWQVGSSATLGTGSVFRGNLLAQESIAAKTKAEIDGRLLAITSAVTLDSNKITKAVCDPPVIPTSTSTEPTTTSTSTEPTTTSTSTEPTTTSTSTEPTTTSTSTEPTTTSTSTEPTTTSTSTEPTTTTTTTTPTTTTTTPGSSGSTGSGGSLGSLALGSLGSLGSLGLGSSGSTGSDGSSGSTGSTGPDGSTGSDSSLGSAGLGSLGSAGLGSLGSAGLGSLGSLGSMNPDTPDTPDVPGIPGTPDTPDGPGTPGTPDTPDTPVGPGTPGAPDAPGTPGSPQAPGTSEGGPSGQRPHAIDGGEASSVFTSPTAWGLGAVLLALGGAGAVLAIRRVR